ncbi:MAG: phosphatase [Robiginitomaculum sp.]|nr:MAG: phosphatase [Robiginitomaculum sp.]
MRLQALIFDVDGTLAETEEAHRRAFNETFATNGLGWHWDQELYGQLLLTPGGKERMAAYVEHHLGQDPQSWRDRIAQWHLEKTRHYTDLIAGGEIAFRPGIRTLIQQATGVGLRLAIATTTSRPNVDALILACTGQPANSIFEVIAAGDEVHAKKPAPDVYELALERLQLDPSVCLAFEDTAHGLHAARAAQLPTVVVPARYSMQQDFSGATLLANSYQDLSVDQLAQLVTN